MQPGAGVVRVVESRFLLGAASAASLPEGTLPEVAFAGRSNVGKSSLIQRLVGGRGLVRISGTPGRTRQINLFEIALADGKRFVLADLPGYGWARVSRKERRSWGALIERYLETRGALRSVVAIIDARRGVEEDDVALADYLRAIGRPMIACATKVDKLAKNRAGPAVAAIGRALGCPAIAFSAKTGEGKDEIWSALLATLDH
ncbi:MAG: YihA family ribosome biogenesis GTP-binding protein [Deltaproteobacteria bacterium]|nr:YihA family ribosome biogenesis GTP-binding protein [Deltaproteobacteria bacterium]